MNTNTTSKIAPDGQGRLITFLSPAYTPVYYNFNCRPRQVKYYKVEQATKQILEGGYDRKGITKFLEKVTNGYLKAKATCDGYKSEMQSIDVAISTNESYSSRQYLRKERNAIETKYCNLGYKVDNLKACIDKLQGLLASENA